MVIRKAKIYGKKFYSKQGSRITERNAIKEHQCVECCGGIHIGDKYREISYEDGREHHTIRVCKECWGKSMNYLENS